MNTRVLFVADILRTSYSMLNAMKDAPSFTEWKFEDKQFLHAPPPPDGDPWSIILNPLLDSSGAQCDIWKDEVQNLLIFAGLFSAVVTTFVIESYKTLSPDPQDDMVFLLSQILQRMEDPLNNTEILPTTTPFVQDSLFVRVNSFWFLSLILSLTTVLVGIVSLQWLREHRNYSDPDLNTKQIFGLFRIREEGLRRWKIPLIFELLPVLLEGALVLFLVGMIDFVRPLGKIISVPTTIATGVTLMFLVATTTLPTLQRFGIYLNSLLSTRLTATPSPCPFKSPQSRAFYALCIYALRLTSNLTMLHTKPAFDIHRKIMKVLSESWSKTEWQKSDIGWIHLRDMISFADFYYQSSHPTRLPAPTNPLHLEIHATSLDQLPFEHSFPLYDILFGFSDVTRHIARQGLVSQAKERYISAAYHCFSQISSIVTSPGSGDFSINFAAMYKLSNHVDFQEYHHRYFQHIFNDRGLFSPCILDCLSGSSMLGAWYRPDDSPTLLHLEHLAMFLTKVGKYTSTLQKHLAEVKIRAIQGAYIAKHDAIRQDRGLQLLEARQFADSIPNILSLSPSPSFERNFEADVEFKFQQFWTIATFLENEKQRVCLPEASYRKDWRNTDVGYSYLFTLLHGGAWGMKYLRSPNIRDKMEEIIRDIIHSIVIGLHSHKNETRHRLLHFYVSKILFDCLIADGALITNLDIEINHARKALNNFKQKMWDEVDNGRELTIEEHFEGMSSCPWIWECKIFSQEWWGTMGEDRPQISRIETAEETIVGEVND